MVLRHCRSCFVHDSFCSIVLGVAADKCQSFAFFVASARTANAMDIVVVSGRNVVVDDVGDVGNVKSAGGDIGRHEHLKFVFFEIFQRALALRMIFVAVNGFGLETFSYEFFGNSFDAVFCSAEDQELC